MISTLVNTDDPSPTDGNEPVVDAHDVNVGLEAATRAFRPQCRHDSVVNLLSFGPLGLPVESRLEA